MKNANSRRVIPIFVISIISIIAILGVNATTSSNANDIEAIKNVLIKSATIADKMYIDTNISYRVNALDENTSNLIDNYTAKFFDVFSENINVMNTISGKTMKEVWIDAQITNVKSGPDCIDCGISNIEIKDISITNNTAYVTAVLTKYLVDRVIKDGKTYLDKIEGEVFKNATLTKTDNQWKIVKYESNPQYGEYIHTLTEEK